MEGFDHIGIAIVYDDLLVRLEDGTLEYANYKTEVTSIPNSCTKSVLENRFMSALR